MIYMTRRNISFNDGRPMIPRGTIIMQGEMSDSAIAKLEKRGALVEVVFSDEIKLVDVPGWVSRARRMLKVGYENVMEVVFTDDKELAKAVGVKLPTIEKWKQELREYLAGLVRPAGC
jgi:hypothetical protein